MPKFNPGDTAEVRTPCAYQGEVGRVLKAPRLGAGQYRLQMSDGSRPTFCRHELKHSQQHLKEVTPSLSPGTH